MPEGLYFITDRKDHDSYIYKSTKIKVVSEFSAFIQYMDSIKYTGLDSEFNNSKPYIGNLLLVQIGERKVRFVIDATCSLFAEFVTIMQRYRHILYIGHNVKADYKKLAVAGVNLPNLYDTMVAEQRLYLGYVGIKHALKEVYFRYMGMYMDSDKETRKDFQGMTMKSTYKLVHILYSADDVIGLIEIAKMQQVLLRERGQYEWFRTVECPLVHILGDMEIEGITLYEDLWTALIVKKKKEKFETELKLDEHFRTLNIKLRKRKKAEYKVYDLFTEPTIVENANKRNLNYNSSQQILKVIRKLNLPVPLLKEKGSIKPSLKETALQQYLMEYPRTPIRKFITDLLTYKGCEKFISSYGEKFLKSEVRKKTKMEPGYKNAVTGQVQTLYKQCETDTGRLASGYAKEGYFNSQNLPADKEIRACFGLTKKEIAEGWFLTTCDLSGAELIIMAALANDMHLYELGADKIINGKKIEGDLHSPLATKAWRAVYDRRLTAFLAQHGMQTWDTASKEKLDEYFSITDTNDKVYVLTRDFEIIKDKKHPNIQLRTDFKRMGFGVVYGLKANKGSQTLNIPKEDAQVVIKVIEDEIPLTIKMVKQAAEFALIDGYVTFNSISNNRRWFRPVVELLNKVHIPNANERYWYTRKNLDFREISEIEGAARNCRIQGTQADMIKEAKVRIKQFSLNNNIPMIPLLSVHDELVVKHKGADNGRIIEHIMTETANRYLAPYSDTIKMRAEAATLTHWTK